MNSISSIFTHLKKNQDNWKTATRHCVKNEKKLSEESAKFNINYFLSFYWSILKQEIETKFAHDIVPMHSVGKMKCVW